MRFVLDLHNHSCLSPCGSLEMSPRAIARRARALGTDVIGLTDHNSTLNCPAMEAACAREGLIFLPGMEAQPREEVHVLCLFPSLDAAMDFGAEMAGLLGGFRNDPERLGDQVYVDEDESILGEVEAYLGQSLDISLDGLAEAATLRGGIVVPAHIDRAYASMKTALGFLPEGPWAAVESTRVPPEGIDPRGYGLVIDSDAHHLEDVGRRRTALELPDGLASLCAPERFRAIARALGSAPREFLFRPR